MSAPKKNKNAVGNKGGRPPKYKNEEEIAKKLREYFAKCDKEKSMPNKAGLCVFLEVSRPVYNDYKGKFPNALKAFEAVIEDKWVQNLSGPHAAGTIFYLKNAFAEHYKDKQETDITSGNKPIAGVVLMPRKLTSEEADAGAK